MSQTIFDIVIPIALAAFVGLLTLAGRWIAAQKWASDQENTLMTAIIAAAQRAKDKYLDEIQAAKDPNSEGGAEITPNEKSVARQRAFDIVMQSLKGPALDYAKDKGEHLIKGLIGNVLDKLIAKQTPGIALIQGAPIEGAK